VRGDPEATGSVHAVEGSAYRRYAVDCPTRWSKLTDRRLDERRGSDFERVKSVLVMDIRSKEGKILRAARE
jgi:hypothetical protein